MCDDETQHDGSAMHVWMPTNKMWVLARPARDGNKADTKLKRGRERFEQPTANSADLSDDARRTASSHPRDAAAKRRRAGEPSDGDAERARSPTGSAPAAPSPSPGDAPPANLPPGPSDDAHARRGRVSHSTLAKSGSSWTAQADSSDDADDGIKPRSGGAQQAALRIAVAAGERESERYTGFELMEELTQEQLEEAAVELYEPLPTCPICALPPACSDCAWPEKVETRSFVCIAKIWR